MAHKPSYKTPYVKWKEPPKVITPCPVCAYRRQDAAALKEHNLRCAQTGERIYRWK